MADTKKQEEEKEVIKLNGKVFKKVGYEDLVEHAKSLGGEKTVEALKYIIELRSPRSLTDEEREKEREKLKSKTKQKRDKVTKKLIDTGKPLYTDEEIEEKLSKKTFRKSPLIIKTEYCKKYFPAIVPKGKDKENETDIMLAKALAEAEAAL